MKKIDNFANCLNILKGANFDFAHTDDIYRTGVIGQFNLSFELAWKALQAVLQEHGIIDFKSGSPREILQTAYRIGFIQDENVWLQMLRTRNISMHIYNESEVSEMLRCIQDDYISALADLLTTLKTKHTEACGS